MFPTLVPNEQVTVTYPYFPPLLWSSINSQTRSDEGFAEIVTVLPTRNFPNWLGRTAWALIVVGAVATVWALVSGPCGHSFPPLAGWLRTGQPPNRLQPAAAGAILSRCG